MVRKLTTKYLQKRKIPNVLISGLILASVLGWTGWKNLDKIKNYYQIKQIFPQKTIATQIIDGDTFVVKNGMTVRLLGIDAPNRGKEGSASSSAYLSYLIMYKPLDFEYDQYQDDKYGRILAYVWINCLQEIIHYCRNKKMLVNEVMVKQGYASKLIYADRKKLKYADLLQ